MERIKKKIIRNLRKIGIDLEKIPKRILEKNEKEFSDIIEENLDEILEREDIEKIRLIYIWEGELEIELWR